MKSEFGVFHCFLHSVFMTMGTVGNTMTWPHVKVKDTNFEQLKHISHDSKFYAENKVEYQDRECLE